MDALSDEGSLWSRYRQQGDRQAHQVLFDHYVPWSRAVARDVYRRVRLPQVDWADYAQNATVGLLEAMGRFDPERGIDFMAYAKPRVRGAVFNGLRCFLSDMARRGPEADRHRDRFSSFDDSESEDILGQFVASVTGLALGFLIDNDAASESLRPTDSSERQAEQHQLDAIVLAAVGRLPEKEAMVIRLHYYQYMPFVDIARLMGLTKGRISQIHKAAIERIRANAWALEIAASL
jgi:RNA polymerase sigma factor for flagellar operon FliA